MNMEFRWALVVVLLAAFVALFFSLQLGFFLLVFAVVGWWVWLNPEEGFLFLLIVAPLLSMFKATQTISTVTLVKDVIILLLFVRQFLWPLITQRLPYRRSILFAPAFMLVAWTGFETLRADALPLGILRAREIVLYLLLYFGVLYLPHSLEAWKRRLSWFTVSVVLTTLLAAYQWFFAQDSAVLRFDPGRSIWIPRISSTFGHPSVYGEYLIAAATLFASCMTFLRRGQYKILFGFLFLLTLPFIFLTYSRAVWIGFVAAIGTMAVVYIFVSGKKKVSPAKWGGLAAVLIVLLFGLLRFTPAGPLLRSAFDPTYKSNEARLEFAARLVAPMSNVDAIIGRGLGDVVQQKLVTTDVGVDEITTGDAREVQLAKDSTLVDNQYLKTFVEMGLIGLVIYFWLFWRFANGAWKSMQYAVNSTQKIIGLWAAGFLVAFIVQGLFIDIWDIFPTNAMFWVVGGVVSAALTPVTEKFSIESKHGRG